MIEKKHSDEITELEFKCNHNGCSEVFRLLYSNINSVGKKKKDSEEKLKINAIKHIERENMPDPEHPEIWYCDEHKGANNG